jgi:transcriptional regulator with XRE-family HTH domain
MAPIGEILRDERLRRGLKLEQVTECTKIGQAHLQAIETNRFDRLPRGLYARSFIRQYTRMLDLDEELLIASFKEQFEQPILPLPALYSRTLNLSMTSSFAWLGVLFVAAGAIYTLREDTRRSMPNVQTTPMHLAHVDSRSGALVEKRVQPRQVVPAASEYQALAVSAQTERNLSLGTIAVGHVVFSAREPVWVSVESDGKRVYRGTLGRQERKELEASGKLIALVGNAGGLEVSVNGDSIGSLGQHGEVCQLELTPGMHVVSSRPDQ